MQASEPNIISFVENENDLRLVLKEKEKEFCSVKRTAEEIRRHFEDTISLLTHKLELQDLEIRISMKNKECFETELASLKKAFRLEFQNAQNERNKVRLLEKEKEEFRKSFEGLESLTKNVLEFTRLIKQCEALKLSNDYLKTLAEESILLQEQNRNLVVKLERQAQLENELVSLKVRCQELESANAQSCRDLTKDVLLENLQSLEAENREQVEQFNEVKSQIEPLKIRLAELENDLTEIKKELVSKDLKLISIIEKERRTARLNVFLRTERDAIKAHFQSFEEELKSLHRDNRDFDYTLFKQRESILEASLERFCLENETLKKELEEKTLEIERLRAEISPTDAELIR